jgi:diguanylate cyclase (GGDEF)-like protein
VSFGRRLAHFFLLIALVPAAALIGILLFVSEDSRRGKADARLAAGIETAVAVYAERGAAAREEARRLAGDPTLARAIRAEDRSSLRRFARKAVASGPAVSIEVTDLVGAIAKAGPSDAVAFSLIELTQEGTPVGELLVSTTTAEQYVEQVLRLTQRDLILSRNQIPVAATLTAPSEDPLEPDETKDLEVDGREFRGREILLNESDGESVLLLGPRKEGDVLGVGTPALGIVIWFLIVAVVLAWALARTLTRLHDTVAEQAITDPLTGLWNRRYMGETLDREVSRSLRFGHEISLIILDVDDFKEINDKQGHLVGDIVLETVADLVREATRSIDVAARYGGDELALILVETGHEGAVKVAERLGKQARETEIDVRGGRDTMQVTLSLGVATIPDSANDLESLVDGADRALLEAKRAGKDQIRAAPDASAGTGGRRRSRRARAKK